MGQKYEDKIKIIVAIVQSIMRENTGYRNGILEEMLRSGWIKTIEKTTRRMIVETEL